MLKIIFKSQITIIIIEKVKKIQPYIYLLYLFNAVFEEGQRLCLVIVVALINIIL